MTKKIRLSIINAGMYVVKNLCKHRIISKQTAIKWIWNITIAFGKKEKKEE